MFRRISTTSIHTTYTTGKDDIKMYNQSEWPSPSISKT